MKWFNLFRFFRFFRFFRKEKEFKVQEGARYYAETTFGTNPADRNMGKAVMGEIGDAEIK